MNFLTHVLISKTLYRHLSEKMELDQKSFSYGNIKPDLSPQCLRKPHMLENYLFLVYHDSNQLISHSTPIKEFSIELGVLCHYICDFFCYCHLNHKLYHKLFRHFIYEIRLHVVLCGMLLGHKTNLPNEGKAPAGNLAAMVMEMRREYMTKPKTLQRDIEYALLTSLYACQLIDRLSKNAAESSTASGYNSLKAFYSPCRG